VRHAWRAGQQGHENQNTDYTQIEIVQPFAKASKGLAKYPR
jgi:hypothetical protein